MILLPLLLAVALHEAAHALAALALGDDTARRAGRLTLNPFPHLELFGSVLLPALCLVFGAPPVGWLRPVPVAAERFARPLRDMALVALAGPAVNVLQALAWWFLAPAGELAHAGVLVNAALAAFNLLPFAGLDGAHLRAWLFPARVPA